MKPLIPALILAALVSGGCDSDPHQERTATPASSSEATTDIGALIRRAHDLIGQDKLDKAEAEEIREIARLLPLKAWNSSSSLGDTLGVIARHRDDDGLIDWLHTGLNPYGKPGLLDQNNALGPATTQAIANYLLEESQPNVRRLYLSLLQVHTSRSRQKEYLHLDVETIVKLLAQWESLGDEKGRYGLPARHYLLTVYSHYAAVNSDTRQFLVDLAKNRRAPLDLRVRALSRCNWWTTGAPERLRFVKGLLVSEEPSKVRVSAVRLLATVFSTPPDEANKTPAFGLLRQLAENDPDPNVRIEAGGGFLSVDDPGTIQWLSGVLRREKDQEVRAGILTGFPLFGYKNKDTNYAALKLLAQLFEAERHPEVQKQAAIRFLRLAHHALVVWEDDVDEASLDPLVLESLLEMARKIKKISPPKETRAEIRKRLELDFEKRFPILLEISEYRELKEYLDK